MNTVRTAKFEDFFRLSNFFYLTIGMVIYQNERFSKAKTLAANVIFYVSVINMNYALCLEMVYAVLAISNDNNFLDATMALAYIGFVIVGNFKMLFVWRKKYELSKFLRKLQHIYPLKDKQQKNYKLPEYLRQCTRITVAFSLIYMITIWTYNLFPVTQFLIYDKLLGIRKIEKALPYYIYTPWDWSQHWSYYVLYVSQDFAAYTSAAGQMSGDLLLCSCATQLIMHYNYLARCLEEYKTNYQQNNINKQKEYRRNFQFLRSMIQYHSYMLKLSHQLNDIFGLSILLNFIASSFVICFLGFQISLGASVEIILKLCLFLGICIAQIYLICYYGQELIDQSFNISLAAYNHEWPDLDVRLQKMLLLMTVRAQKPVQLKATTLVLISMETMTQVMQISYKFFALLKTMYAEV